MCTCGLCHAFGDLGLALASAGLRPHLDQVAGVWVQVTQLHHRLLGVDVKLGGPGHFRHLTHTHIYNVNRRSFYSSMVVTLGY